MMKKMPNVPNKMLKDYIPQIERFRLIKININNENN